MAAAVSVPVIAPSQTPSGRAKGMNRAKTNRQKMGVVSRLEVFWVIAVMLPGIAPMNELPTTTNRPMEKARNCEARTWPVSDLGLKPNRSKKSVITTAVMEFTPESRLDIAAANIPATTRPEMPGGRW